MHLLNCVPDQTTRPSHQRVPMLTSEIEDPFLFEPVVAVFLLPSFLPDSRADFPRLIGDLDPAADHVKTGLFEHRSSSPFSVYGPPFLHYHDPPYTDVPYSKIKMRRPPHLFLPSASPGPLLSRLSI